MSTPDDLAAAVSTQPGPGLTRVAGPVPPEASEVGGLTRDVWLFETGDLAVDELEVDGASSRCWIFVSPMIGALTEPEYAGSVGADVYVGSGCGLTAMGCGRSRSPVP
jgi:hypothetical protein